MSGLRVMRPSELCPSTPSLVSGGSVFPQSAGPQPLPMPAQIAAPKDAPYPGAIRCLISLRSLPIVKVARIQTPNCRSVWRYLTTSAVESIPTRTFPAMTGN
jgi:hypothetical protein